MHSIAEKRKNTNAERLSKIFTRRTRPQIYEDSGDKQLRTLLTGLKFPRRMYKKTTGHVNGSHIGHNTCFPESVPKETNEETKQGKQSEEHFGRYSSWK